MQPPQRRDNFILVAFLISLAYLVLIVIIDKL